MELVCSSHDFEHLSRDHTRVSACVICSYLIFQDLIHPLLR